MNSFIKYLWRIHSLWLRLSLRLQLYPGINYLNVITLNFYLILKSKAKSPLTNTYLHKTKAYRDSPT